jgi:hypothetical protein
MLEEPVSFFLQEIGNESKCTIFDTVGNVRTATPEECVGVERAAAWDDVAVKQRLMDTFAGGRTRLANDSSRRRATLSP